ncbi:mechanosensitive ion channel family protein [Pedobacter lusitanus]|nr:mechanosensitive ion channel domain-containing protein [Pedobacter lusitanus]
MQMQTADTSTNIPDTLLFKIQQAQAAIAAVDSKSQDIELINRIKMGLSTIKTHLSPIRAEVYTPEKAIDPQTLLSYKLIVKDARRNADNWVNALATSSKALQNKAQQILVLSRDSSLRISKSDSSSKKFYNTQLSSLRLKLLAAGKSNNRQLDSVSRLLATLSAFRSATAELQVRIDNRIRSASQTVFHKESAYLWASPKDQSFNFLQLLKSSYEGQDKAFKYFFNITWDNRLLLIIIVCIFFFWIYSNFKKASKPENRRNIGELQFIHIKAFPVIPSLIILFTLAPLFEPNASSIYIQLTQLLLLTVLTYHFNKQISSHQFNYWLLILVLYILIIVSIVLLHDGIWIRLWLILLNAAAIYIGLQIYMKLKDLQIAGRLIRPVYLIYLFLNLCAVILNIFGRISLAGTCTITAIIGLTQLISLALFVQIVSEAIWLQIKVSACTGGIFSRINVQNTKTFFKRILTALCILLWLLDFLINLNISENVFSLLHKILEKPRSFGSIHFTLSNVFFFTIIIYLSNLIQKYIGILFGGEKVTFSNETRRKDSKLSLIRLAVILAGVMLAITASGIPADKLTVVLGALGVGIGLGMQNIVNNFVSGIILMFEKPFQIGDYIELADKKGKIRDIGIRSSKMLTQQGSEVIIPNGDLLSGRLVNWTLSNNYLKTEVLIKVHIDSDLSLVNNIINQEVSRLPEIIKNQEPEILINSISTDSIEIKLLVWITSIYKEPTFKSQLLKQLLLKFRIEEIKMM